jgi:hypothetical protein
MRLRREPNNRLKPTHLKYFSASQRQSPSGSEDFPVLIQPNFLMDFLSETAQEGRSASAEGELKTIKVW